MGITATGSISTTVNYGEDNGEIFPALTPIASFNPPVQNYTAGTNAGQIDVPHGKRYTVASGSPQSLDLSGGTLKTLLGNAANFARVATLAFSNRGSNTVTLTGNFFTTNFGASFSMPIPPNGRFIYDDPSATALVVTNSTADTITITSAAGSVPVDVAIGGRSV